MSDQSVIRFPLVVCGKTVTCLKSSLMPTVRMNEWLSSKIQNMQHVSKYELNEPQLRR